ncbi:flagellar hook assembly protein FlgD [Devosia sp. J2-20]|jgi:flagellar basal-body rod modification protein FlgD|uniref:Basal-body rod modification protein FlgD n=1 Tax=Devosia litorisediminis TaxID=2829817 RepID=A0A942IC29_9HYPH|nr:MULTISPECIES: flagellar hook assembly protein FlgD [Devosia]MBS3847299.1 flagellar hook assembly protein FlgD [Devosia litorisediminis]MCZ4346671.1 flagellar hook assembly protein FlgD [Devosia neptuniae]WDQ99569.1 flagellar hook assembly protein FlgD [Devosia sp. J2-20]|tara:strand:+ start:601 stop:1308 length:708 start_codon:yes stop_codon:yes gene_type:complete
MAVSGVSGTGTSSTSTARAGIADNFDTFLNILTTQLKNQNPLDPLDTNQFTQQLVQFSGVEQQLKANEFLETLMLAGQNTAKSDAVSYIGKQVTSTGKTGELTDKEAVFWSYNAEAQVANATVTIKNAGGSVVYTETGSLNAGPGTFRWDGMGSDGNTQPNGIYTIDIKGSNVQGRTVDVTTSSIGIASGVDFTGSVPILTVGSRKVAITDVTDVRLPPTSTTTVGDQEQAETTS